MSERDLKLQVVFNMIERITAPLKRIIGESTASSKALKALRDRLKDLDSQQKNLSSFRHLHTDIKHTAGRLEEARQRAKSLAEQLQATENPTRTMTREFDRATKAARLIKEQHQQQGQQLQALRDKLNAAGISTNNLSSHERSLRSNMSSTNSQIDAQKRKLAELAAVNDKVAAAQNRMKKTRGSAGDMAVSGMGMTMAGTTMGFPVVKSIDQAAQFQQQVSRLRALGIGDEMVNEGVKFAKGMDIMGSSSLENLKLLTEAQSILRDFHHAKDVTPMLAQMKFGIEGVMQKRGGGEGHGEAAERMFMDLIKVAELRGALKDMDTFKRVLDFSTKAYVASGGLVKPEDLLNMIKTGGVAAKQLSDDSFFFGMLHSIQEMGGDRTGTAMMSAYQNWAVGRTTQQTAEELHKDGLINPDSIKYGKTGHVTKLMPDALKNAEKYKSDPFLYLMEDVLPKIQKPGMTDNQVVSKITTLFSSRNAANLMSSMYLERANIQKHRVAAKGAFGIDQLNQESGAGVNGKYLDLIARRNTLEQELGEHILPIVNSGLQMLTSTIKTVTEFFREHSTTAKALSIGVAVLAGSLVVMGTLTLALASLLGPFALLRFGMAMIGIKGAFLAGTFARVGAGFARIGPFIGRMLGWLRGLLPALRLVGTALMVAGRASLAFGAALMANPIFLAIAAIAALAAGAYYLYHHWAPAKQFFDGIWSSIKEAFNGGISGVAALLVNWSPLGLFHRAMAGVLGYFGIDIPAKFTEFGSFMMQGLVNGITNAASTVRDTISSMADNVVSWFKEKLGIHSPSVVFAELGQFSMEGLAIGIERGQLMPLNKLNAVTKQMTALGTGLAFSAAMTPAFAMDMPQPLFNPQQVAMMQFAAPRLATEAPGQAAPIQFDRRPPVAQAGNAPANQYHSADSIQIIINPPAGTDPQAIAKAVAAELDKRERQKAQQKRSAMHDYDEY
ncbi:phage tail tape measure protein [Undibacterium sp. TC9W]|uniref:phage tail tape measure protein n=1 Tax=Undibacterium sp. TC9W TaxID=3413053 RepID=UPI003BF09332